MVRDSDSTTLLTPQGVCFVICQFLSKNVFPPYLSAILKFCRKCENAFIWETVQDRVISTKVLPPGYIENQQVFLSKNCFPTIFGGHLEILHKMLKSIYLNRAISVKILTSKVSIVSAGNFCQKSFCRHFWWPFLQAG